MCCIAGDVDAQLDAQLIQHPQHASQLHGFFATFDFTQKHMPHTGTACGVVQAQALCFAYGTDGDAQIGNGLDGDLHGGLKSN